MSKRTRRPSMPDPRSPQFLDAVKEVLEQMQGQRGLAMDANVSFRDLVDAGLAEQGPGGTIRPAGAQTDTSPGGSVRDPQVTVPPPVRDIAAGGAFTRVLLTWGPPRYRNHSMVEIARSQDNDIGNSVIIGTTGARTYTDVVGGGFTGFWWLRNVSTAGVRGPWSAPVSASTPRDFDEIQESATSYPWQPSTAYGLFNAVAPTVELFLGTTRVVLVATTAGTSGATEPDWADEIDEIGDTVTDGTVTWEAVEAGRVPFVIDPVTGLLVIEGAAIRNASINALQVRDGFFDQITAAKGSLGEANISIANIFNALVQNQISSDNFSAGLEGWRITRTGDAEFNNVEMRGRLQNSSGRYIDLRPGAPTDGDFVLGDVESNNFISFRDEGPTTGRILRIRGDVLLRDYEPGNILLIGSNVTRSRSQLPVSAKRANGDNCMTWWPGYIGGPVGYLTVPDGEIQSVYNTFFLSSTMNQPGVFVLKETIVTREGTLTAEADFTRSIQSGANGSTPNFDTLSRVPMVGMRLLRVDGSAFVFYKHSIWDATSGTMQANVAVKAGDRVQVIAAHIYFEFIYRTSNPGFTERSLSAKGESARYGSGWESAACQRLDLKIGFHPFEASLL